MILEVQHETRLEYTEPVVESMAEVRMEPASDSDQSCRSFHLAVSPPTELFRYQDGFGNRVHHFNLLAAHSAVRIFAAAIVETHARPQDLTASEATWPLRSACLDLGTLDFLSLRGPVRPTPLLGPLLGHLQPAEGMRLTQLVMRVAEYLQTHFEYARDVTLATSPVDDLLKHGKGVCQDFTHLMIAVLRSFDVPARYVSGYIHRPDQEAQSHAWCEVWLPDLGWCGVDPTNNRLVNEHFIKVAIGRDFSDVPPNKGTYRGQAQEEISVRVETRELNRLPSLAWQEQLPPLNAPLTAIVPRTRWRTGVDEETVDQQQ